MRLPLVYAHALAPCTRPAPGLSSAPGGDDVTKTTQSVENTNHWIRFGQPLDDACHRQSHHKGTPTWQYEGEAQGRTRKIQGDKPKGTGQVLQGPSRTGTEVEQRATSC